MTNILLCALACITGPDLIDVVTGTLQESVIEYYFQSHKLPQTIRDMEQLGKISLPDLRKEYGISGLRFERAPAPARKPFWSFSALYRHEDQQYQTTVLVPICEPAYLWRVRYKSTQGEQTLELVDTIENQAHFIAEAVDWYLPGARLPRKVRDVLKPGTWSYDLFSSLRRHHQFALEVARKPKGRYILTLRHIATGKTFRYELPKSDRGFSFVHVNGKVPWRY